MGFFTSKKVDDTSFVPDSDMSVVQAIRSRIYGKSKGKQREIISSPAISSPRGPGTQRSGDRPINGRGPNGTIVRKERPSTAPPTGINGTKSKPKTPPASAPPATDVMTQTLAQRLNELAVSNSEGLLNDEEYRLLRQNLFERFASGAVAPSEAPVVPVARASRRSGDGNGRPSVSSTQGRPSSQFHVDTSRTPSLNKKPSMSSTVSTLFRRGSRRRSASGPHDSAASDASSLFSMNSSTSNAIRRTGFSRMLSRKGSDASIRTETSRMPYDASFTSRPSSSAMDQNSLSPSGSVSRSTTRSLRRLAAATPPSSFNARLSTADTIGPGPRHLSSMNMQDVFDDENLQSAKDIRTEIELVEAEGRRLLDAFNGLELSTLTRRQRRPTRMSPVVSPSSDGSRSREGADNSTWTLTPERRRRGTDVDATSIRSNTSVGTTLSAAKSQHSGIRLRTTPGANKSVAILRKNSLSSVSSRATSTHGLPPVPPLPSARSIGHLGVGSTSSVNLSRSIGHSPLSALPESDSTDRQSLAESRFGGPGDLNDDEDIIALEGELGDIRKRRGEVTARYETRLEYLRAKLKGAELHEKLLRK